MTAARPYDDEATDSGHYDRRYRVERTLGRGGMATVHAVVDTSTGKRVALKRLTAGSSQRNLVLFEREFQTLASLHHPAIVRVYDYGSDAVGPYYTMELLEGSDLSKRAPMAWREVCACLRDAASILGVLHVRRLVHRDLSPKNLWLTLEGRLKILDFGALSPFGAATELAGTPPMIAPEALAGHELDARTDLYSLGALGYWLLTGVHAYPAHSIGELLDLQAARPARAGDLEQLINRKGLVAPPRELTNLIISLLRTDPRERPASTSVLVDQLGMLASLEPEVYQVAALSYVHSKPLVGRQHELDMVSQALVSAHEGRGRRIAVEGEPGMGRTRFAQEAAILARVGGAACAVADAASGVEPFAAAEALALAIRNALPVTAEQLVRHAELVELLRHRRANGVSPSGAPSEAQLVQAWVAWWTALARATTVAIFVDDVHAIDEGSRALLDALANECSGHRLLIVTTAVRDSLAPSSSAQGVAVPLSLGPLTQADAANLLQSIFGNHLHVQRLATWLGGASGGNPRSCVQLIEHLVESEVIHYRDGFWVLPRELDATNLPARPSAARSLSSLSDAALALARALSIPHFRALTLPECVAMTELDGARIESLLSELHEQGVLEGPAADAGFRSNATRGLLCAELTKAQAMQLHARLARVRLANAGGDPLALVDAAYHYVRAGDVASAKRLWCIAFREVIVTPAFVREFAPIAEDSYQQLLAQGADESAFIVPGAALAIAGYFIDRRYARQFGDRVLASLEQQLQLPLVRKLTPYLGRLLGLVIGLAVAGFVLRRKAAPRLREVVALYVSACSALCGTAASCLDNDGAARYAAAMEPFNALGAKSATGIVHAVALNMALMVADRRADSYQNTRALLALLESPRRIRGLRPDHRMQYATAMLYCMGVNARFRDDGEVLAIADRLERIGAVTARNAGHLRASYFASQGQLAEAEACLRRVEEHTVEHGAAWHTEIWIPADALSIAMRLNDALMMKRAARELSRLARELPAVKLAAQHARGMYLVMRGKYAEAVALLDTPEEPLARMGWLRARAMLARAHNGLGDHARARELCLDALSRISVEERMYVRMGSLMTALELALAEAGLGDFTSAQLRVDELFALHGPQNSPLTLGSIHEMSARIALMKGQCDVCREHIDALAKLVRPTGIPSWIDRIEALERLLSDHSSEVPSEVHSYTPTRPERLPEEFRVLLQNDLTAPREERARKLILAALKHCRAERGFILVSSSQSVIAQAGEPAEPELVAWAVERVCALDLDACTTESSSGSGGLTSTDPGAVDANTFERGGARHRLIPLRVRTEGVDSLLGVMVLSTARRDSLSVDAAVARAVAANLA
jgi:Protein kinase domain/AAA ATPase domain